MLHFLILLFVSILSTDQPSKDYSTTTSATNHIISSIGFHDVIVRSGDTITGILSNGENRLFIVIPTHPQITLKEITIDNHPFMQFLGKKGFAINGKENVTFIMNSSDTDSMLHINAWLLPNKYCSNSAIFSYGSRKIRYQSTLSTNSFCIFSPTLDSKNNHFKINYGIKNTTQPTYSTSLYKSDFNSALQTTIGEKIVNYEFDGPHFIQFNFDSRASNETIAYERRTKVAHLADKANNKCIINPFYRCSDINDSIECLEDQAGKIDFEKCAGLGMSKSALGLIITAGTLGILSGIAGIVLCSCCCSCCACCCCNRNHKSRKNAKKND